jgi:RimJ/RimL family protein N-acetyltransferase
VRLAPTDTERRVPHPAEMLPSSPIALRDGSAVLLRPQRPDDGPRLAEFFAALSPHSRYQRFFTGMPSRLPRGILKALANVDGDRHVGVVAERDGRVVGAARYVRSEQTPEVADVAFTVADELQGNGLGRRLMRELQAHAARRGITRFVFDVLPANDAALAVAQSLGAHLRRDGATLAGTIYIDSGADTPSRPSVRARVRRVATQRPSRNDCRSAVSARST